MDKSLKRHQLPKLTQGRIGLYLSKELNQYLIPSPPKKHQTRVVSLVNSTKPVQRPSLPENGSRGHTSSLIPRGQHHPHSHFSVPFFSCLKAEGWLDFKLHSLIFPSQGSGWSSGSQDVLSAPRRDVMGTDDSPSSLLLAPMPPPSWGPAMARKSPSSESRVRRRPIQLYSALIFTDKNYRHICLAFVKDNLHPS